MFTMMSPNGYPNSHLTFSTTITNSGDYDAATGTFTCSQPGNYFFYFSLLKNKSSDTVYCSLVKNGKELVRMYVDDGSSHSYDAGSNSAIEHFNLSDTAYLTSCSPIISMDYHSSFTGFLVKPDN